MLLEKSHTLINLSNEKIELQGYATQLDGFKSRQEQISQATLQLIPIVESLKIFRQKGLVNIDLSQKVEKILSFIATVEANFKNDPEWILDNKNFNGNYFKASIETSTKEINQELQQDWQDYVQQKTPNTNQEILNLLANIESFKPTVENIRRLKNKIPQDKFPKDLAEFEEINQSIEFLREAWKSLSSDEVPDAVIRFLRAAANQGASLSLFTPEVKEWLDKNKLTDSVRIRLS